MNPTQNVRAWIYRVATAVMPLLIAYGVVNEKDAALWIGAVTSLTVSGLAAVNTPRSQD